MKTKYLFFILILSIQWVNSQEKKSHFINEYSISLNHAYNNDNGMPEKVSFGAGIFHSHAFFPFFEMKSGLEFVRTRFYTDYGSCSMHYCYKDLTYTLYNMTFPLAMVYSVGRHAKLNIEGGVFFENYLFGYYCGIGDSHPPDGSPGGERKIHELVISELLSYGYFAGVGFQIPFGKNSIIIKSVLNYEPNPILKIDNNKLFYNRYLKISIVYKLL